MHYVSFFVKSRYLVFEVTVSLSPRFTCLSQYSFYIDACHTGLTFCSHIVILCLCSRIILYICQRFFIFITILLYFARYYSIYICWHMLAFLFSALVFLYLSGYFTICKQIPSLSLSESLQQTRNDQ